MNSKTLDAHTIAGSHFGFSATRIDDLGAAEYTLVTICADQSGSVAGFERDIERCIAEVVGACHRSPRADNLLLRVVTFDGSLHEVHGFKPLSSCHSDGYDGALHSGGVTALYDAAANAIEATCAYAVDLDRADFDVNAIVFVITDGEDNASKRPIDSVTAALRDATKSEALESISAVLIGVDIHNAAVSQALDNLKQQAQMTRYIELAKADAATLAKLADFVSRSIAAQSKALGSGAASIPLTF
jgi:uncharacterized protein YegL